MKVLEKALYTQYSIDRQKDYLIWLEKLNEMDYNKRSRALFAHLKSKVCEPENFGAVFDKNGVLSTTLKGSLENWASFYEELYSGHKIPKFSAAYCDDLELDKPFTLIEFTNAVKSLTNNKTPGIDHIRNEDLGLLAQEREDSELLLGCKTALKIVFDMFNSFWKKEKVPQDLKISVLRPSFFKG